VCAVLTIIAAASMTDYTGKDIEGEFEQAGAAGMREDYCAL
jgi:hypothetical protein